MTTSERRLSNTRTLVLGAIFTAIVVILQLIGTVTTFFGPFSTAVGLIPIVIGAAMCGTITGAWLGFVFGMVVLMSGSAALFFAFNVPGTIIVVLLKGIACGFVAGITYKLLSKFNRYLAVIVAAVLCPLTNTAVYLLGSRIFFIGYADAMADKLGLGVTGMELFFALAMGNFLFEIGTNIILSPVIFRVLNIEKKNK